MSVAWIAASLLAGSLAAPDATVRCRQATLDVEGARIATCHVVRGRLLRSSGRSSRHHELTAVIEQSGEQHLLARFAGWQRDVEHLGGTWHALPVVTAGADSVLVLEVVSKMSPSERSIKIIGREVPLSRRASPEEWLPIAVMRSTWVVEVGAGNARMKFDDVQAERHDQQLRVRLSSDATVIVDLAIDPVARTAYEMQGLRVSSDWDRGAALDAIDPALGDQPPEGEAAPPGPAPTCTACR